MKRLIMYIIMGVATLTMVSCNLDLEPESTLSDVAFWKQESDLRNACNRCYQQLTDTLGLGGFYLDFRSDELVDNVANSTSDGSWTIPSNANEWTVPYSRIFTCNNILEKGLQTNVSEKVKKSYFAEAQFFRAFYYFELVKKYGDVPMIMKVVNDTKDPILNMPRTPREKVIQQCYEDLEFAAEWLPDIDNITTWGHVSRSAALAMLVRVGLYEGTYSKYHGLSDDYKVHLKKAIDAAETMMFKDNKHELYPDFEKMFTYNGEGRQNKENIFVKVYGPNGMGTTVHGHSRDMSNSANLTRNIVDLFLYTDGLPRGKSPLQISPETSYDDVFKNRDPRLAMTAYRIGEDTGKDGPYQSFSYLYGYKMKKGFIQSDYDTNHKETVDKILIRYAEVLISYAEALYEYNGNITDTQLDQTVNKLRSRAGIPTMLANAFVISHNLDMLEEIRRERTIEFIDENKRYDDIIRWKIAEKVLPVNILGPKFVNAESKKVFEEMKNRLTKDNGMYNGKKVYDEDGIYILEKAENRRFDPRKDYLYPIPLKEITLSGNKVIQNPYWE